MQENIKRKRGRPRKQKGPPLKVNRYKKIKKKGHKSRTMKIYNMNITMNQKNLSLIQKPLFIETRSSQSNSTDDNNINNRKNSLFIPKFKFESPFNNDSQMMVVSPQKSFISSQNSKEGSSIKLNLSVMSSKTNESQEKLFNLECDKNLNCRMQVNKLSKDCYFLTLKDKNKLCADPFMTMHPSFFDRSDIAVEFFQFASDFKSSKCKELMFAGRLKKKNNFKFEIDYQLLEMTLLSFFQMKNIAPYISKLNDFEYIFISIFLYKKNFVKWSNYNIDFNELQRSKSKKRKEHFLKFLLKKFFKYLSLNKKDFFGENNSKITNRMKSIFFESNRRRKDDPNSHRMENLGKILTKNEDFKKFYDETDMDIIIKEIFNEYSERQMKTLVQNHISRLKEEMKKNVGNPFYTYSKNMFGLMKKKLKIMWTYTEFKQAQEVFDMILNN